MCIGFCTKTIDTHIRICIYIISEGLRPLPPAPNLEDSMIRRFDDSMDC